MAWRSFSSPWESGMVREEGFEPSRVSPRAPKTRASASSATLAAEMIVRARTSLFKRAGGVEVVRPNLVDGFLRARRYEIDAELTVTGWSVGRGSGSIA